MRQFKENHPFCVSDQKYYQDYYQNLGYLQTQGDNMSFDTLSLSFFPQTKKKLQSMEKL